MAPCPRLQVAVLLLVGLSLASAALPKHPFFGSTPAGAKDYRDDYDPSTKLCLQSEKACFGGYAVGSYGGHELA